MYYYLNKLTLFFTTLFKSCAKQSVRNPNSEPDVALLISAPQSVLIETIFVDIPNLSNSFMMNSLIFLAKCCLLNRLKEILIE